MNDLPWVELTAETSVPMFDKWGSYANYLLKIKPEYLKHFSTYYLIERSFEKKHLKPEQQNPFTYPKHYFSHYIEVK